MKLNASQISPCLFLRSYLKFFSPLWFNHALVNIQYTMNFKSVIFTAPRTDTYFFSSTGLVVSSTEVDANGRQIPKGRDTV